MRGFPKLVSKSCLARCGFAALAVVFGANGLQDAAANGDTRTISMHHVHTGEDITITYKRNGRFDDEALKKLNWFLRDWRRNESTKMDPLLIDVVWEVWREVGANTPVSVIGGYRAPATNNMLRQRSKGVARHSQHTVGHAMDFYIPGASLEKMRIAGLRLQRGGVGYYPSSGSPFVHLDTGSVRHWPRMTYDQLARVFPDGRTVHVPSNGKPLPGYAVALAELQKGGKTPSSNSLLAARDAGISTGGGLLASLFRGSRDDDEEETTTASVTPSDKPATTRVVTTKVAAVEIKAAPKPEQARIANVPLPSQRPAVPEQVAVAFPKPRPQVAVPAPASPAATATLAVASVIDTRGAWDEGSGFRQTTDVAQFRTAALAESEPTTYALLGYASVEKTAPAKKPTFAGLKFTRQANALEVGQRTIRSAQTSTAPMAQQFDDIWLRAVMMAPDLYYYLSATLIGAPDPKELRPLMRKPGSALAITFSNDPAADIPTAHFSGEAVVFLDTVSFPSRTAGLR